MLHWELFLFNIKHSKTKTGVRKSTELKFQGREMLLYILANSNAQVQHDIVNGIQWRCKTDSEYLNDVQWNRLKHMAKQLLLWEDHSLKPNGLTSAALYLPPLGCWAASAPRLAGLSVLQALTLKASQWQVVFLRTFQHQSRLLY